MTRKRRRADLVKRNGDGGPVGAGNVAVEGRPTQERGG